MADVIAHSTRDPKENAPRLAKIADVVHLLVERDVHQLCTDDPLTTLNGWVRFLERATFVQDGYASVLHPYNQAVRTFRLSQSTTCEMVLTQVRRTLRTFAPLWRASVRVATNVYVEVCQAYVRAGNSTWATFEATPARRSLVHWYDLIRPYLGREEWLVGAPSLLEALHHQFAGFTDVASGVAFLTRVYEVKMDRSRMMTSIEAPYLKRRCAKQVYRQFGVETEWHALQHRLLSATPLDGPPSLYYDETVLRAFVDHDASPVQAFGRLLTSEVFREAKSDVSYACLHILYQYATASLQLHARVYAETIRGLWTFLDDVFSGDGPGGVFATDTLGTVQTMQALECRQLATSVLSRVADERAEADEVDDCPHILLGWMVEMMDPCSRALAWAQDREWWLDLLDASADRERLIQEYLDESLSVRLVTGEVDVDTEMDLMVCLSLRFRDVPSRALQRYRLLLSPCSIAPEFPDATSVYLAPQTVWAHVPADLCADASLHPVVQAPLSAAVDAYTHEYFSERRATWSQWYSTATVELERPGTSSYSLTAPVFAVSLVAHVAETSHGCTQEDLVDHIGAVSTGSRLTTHLYVGFWLRQLVEHRVVTTRVVGSTDTSQWTYRLRTWTGTRTVPVPDVPRWWSEDGYRSCTTGGGAKGAAASVGPKAVRKTERLLVTKELVECKCVHTLKHASAPVTQPELLATLRRDVAPIVAVSNQDVSEMVDALVRKGYIARDDAKGGQLTFAAPDDVEVD
jgi:hypothetical protein